MATEVRAVKGIKRSKSYKQTPNKTKRLHDEYGFEEFPKTEQSYDQLDLDTSSLRISVTRLKITCERLDKLKSKIIKKRSKKKSKKLKHCEETYEKLHEDLLSDLKDLKRFQPKERQDHVLEERQDHAQTVYGDRQCNDSHKRQLTIWKLEQDNQRLQGQVDVLQMQLREQVKEKNSEVGRLQGQVEDLQMKLHEALKEKNSEVGRLQEQVEDLQVKLYEEEKEKNIEVGRLQKKANDLKIRQRDEENANADRMRKLQRQVDDLKMRLNKEVEAKEDAIRRLSELASSKLRDNNPNVADLSDQNRPTKLAEEVSEIYDNEWTDAFDELEREYLPGEDIVPKLRDALMDIYAECNRVTCNGYLHRVRRCINQTDMMATTTEMDTVEPDNDKCGLPDQIRQQIKEFRKLDARNNMATLVQGMLSRSPLQYLRKPPFNQACTSIYVKKCVEVAWLMCVQDPPLLLSVDTKKEFNPNLFREYTKRGPYVAYVVWPVLYLHENGPVLNKGVAQGTKNM